MEVQGCIGFAERGFGEGGATRMGSMRSCWKLPLCFIEPMSAGSKTDLLLAKAEPINNGGSASGITELEEWKKTNNYNCSWREE